jgi:hypothetical protein
MSALSERAFAREQHGEPRLYENFEPLARVGAP